MVGAHFRTKGEAVRFSGLMCDFALRNGGRRVQVYSNGFTGCCKKNLYVILNGILMDIR